MFLGGLRDFSGFGLLRVLHNLSGLLGPQPMQHSDIRKYLKHNNA